MFHLLNTNTLVIIKEVNIIFSVIILSAIASILILASCTKKEQEKQERKIMVSALSQKLKTMEKKNTSKKQLRTKAFRERHSRLATKLGCSITVAIIIVAICSFVVTTAIAYLLNILWIMEGDRNPLISAIFSGVWITALVSFLIYLFPYERSNGCTKEE